MDKEQLQKYWEDEDNWSGGIYFCKQDPRLIVPKRPKWGGWTINLGHKLGTVTLILVIGIPVMILVLVLVGMVGL